MHFVRSFVACDNQCEQQCFRFYHVICWLMGAYEISNNPRVLSSIIRHRQHQQVTWVSLCTIYNLTAGMRMRLKIKNNENKILFISIICKFGNKKLYNMMSTTCGGRRHRGNSFAYRVSECALGKHLAACGNVK